MGMSSGKKKFLFTLVRLIIGGAAAYLVYTMLEDNPWLGGEPLYIYGISILMFIGIFVVLAKLKGSD